MNGRLEEWKDQSRALSPEEMTKEPFRVQIPKELARLHCISFVDEASLTCEAERGRC